MPKSQVTVFERDGYLHLRWTYQGKQYRLSTRLPDTKENRKAVQAKVKLIESDIAYERLDDTLEKYGKVAKKAEEFKESTFYSVWLKFLNFKSYTISKGTYGKYTATSFRVHSYFLGAKPSEIKLSSIFPQFFNPEVSKKVLKEQIGYLSACWKWGQKEGLIISELKNPLEGLTEMIKVEPKQPPKPFTGEEIYQILEWFRVNRHHYLPYVQFLFSTGCRLGEAKGLRLTHIDWERMTIWIGEAMRRDNTRKSTKTNKARIIPMNKSIQLILEAQIDEKDRQLDDLDSDELVFQNPSGGAIDDRNFNQRIWKKCLGECGIPYRRPYNCRHTFISHCLEKGMSPTTVASITGHDVQTLYENYAGSVISKPELPELF